MSTSLSPRYVIRSLAIAIPLFTVWPLKAQTPAVVPVPSQLTSAQTMFLGFGGSPALIAKEKTISQTAYQSMYRALQNQKKLALVATPGEADLTMEVSIVSRNFAPGEFANTAMQLVVRDRRTQAVLWTIDEAMQGAIAPDGSIREKTFNQKVDQTAAIIASDLNSLTTGSFPTDSAPPAKTRFSQKAEPKK